MISHISLEALLTQRRDATSVGGVRMSNTKCDLRYLVLVRLFVIGVICLCSNATCMFIIGILNVNIGRICRFC